MDRILAEHGNFTILKIRQTATSTQQSHVTFHYAWSVLYVLTQDRSMLLHGLKTIWSLFTIFPSLTPLKTYLYGIIFISGASVSLSVK